VCYWKINKYSFFLSFLIRWQEKRWASNLYEHDTIVQIDHWVTFGMRRGGGGGWVGQAWDYTETGGPARMPAQVAGWRGHINWNSVRWGKKYFYWGVQSSQKSLVPARQAQRTNQERTPFVCTLWVPIHTSFNSQQGPPLSGLFRFECMWQWVKGELNRCIRKSSIYSDCTTNDSLCGLSSRHYFIRNSN
jgi:hypothetical protein